MAYYDVSLLAADADFIDRATAAYATEVVDVPGHPLPDQWTPQHIWEIAAQPGFGDAYASALAGGVPDPGRDPAVITDPMLLSAVQTLLAAG
jgi:hypothetical protein